MNTINSGQDNRYLESPHVIRDTGAGEQTPSFVNNSVGSGLFFSKDNFLAHENRELNDVRDEHESVPESDPSESTETLALPE